MALRDLKDLQRQADELSPEDQRALVEYLLRKAKVRGPKKKVDINRFAGILKLDEDAMAIQRRLRSEWD